MPDQNPQIPLYPLKFEPIYKTKVWGGRSLETLGRTLPEGLQIGESWELADLATTSVSGGGGGAQRSTVANGPLRGTTLCDLITRHGPALLGGLNLSPDGGFPLLIKYLDASENLSVQVHPSPAYAATHADAFLKSEAWYIVDCAPGSVIYKGMRQGVTPDQLRAALADNTDDAVLPLLQAIPVQPGDCHYLPSGTCHALGAGILVAEVQTPSDTTYRVYDWGRTSRELHIEQALACIHFGPAESAPFEPRTTVNTATAEVTRLVACEYFTIERITATADFDEPLTITEPEIWMLLEGRTTFTCGQGAFGSTVHARPGDTHYLPPHLPHATASIPTATTILRITIPPASPETMA